MIDKKLHHPIHEIQRSFYQDYTTSTLKTLIILWAIFVIFLVLFVIDDKFLLAAILAYEVLP